MGIEAGISWARRLAARAPLLKKSRPLFDRAVAAAGRRRGVAIDAPAGDSFRFDASLFRKSFADHEPEVYSFVMSRLEPGGTFVDVGAWIGLFTLGAAKRVGPGGRVVAIEPSYDTAGLLRRHLALNSFEDRTKVIHAVVGETPGRVPFYAAPGPDMENSLVERPGAAGATIEMTTLDAVVADLGRPPDVVKIDVEGAEYQVLKGARRALLHKPLIVCAIHPDLLRALGDSPEQLMELADELGYAVETLEGAPVTELTAAEVVLAPKR